jgi:hypothetical protein
MIDLPPRSRNEATASHMRRMGLCEEQGSGLDKVIAQAELFQLPPPLFRANDDSLASGPLWSAQVRSWPPAHMASNTACRCLGKPGFL